MQDEQKFVFDDFSVNDDTTDVIINFNGQNVPFSIKRGLTIRERQKASERAIKRHFTPKGDMVVDGVDDATFSIEVVLSAVTKWPFTRRSDGRAVPITRETVEMLDPILLDRLSVAIMGIRENLLKDQETVLDPFENKSDEVTSRREQKAGSLT